MICVIIKVGDDARAPCSGTYGKSYIKAAPALLQKTTTNK